MFKVRGSERDYAWGSPDVILANSDNVLRAGLTSKHVDAQEVLAVVDHVAAPPIRLAPEQFGDTRTSYAPVDDFELSVASAVPGPRSACAAAAARIVLAIEGSVVVGTAAMDVLPKPGEATFVGAHEGAVNLSGRGTIVQADVP